MHVHPKLHTFFYRSQIGQCSMNTRICITSFNTVDVCNVVPSKVRYALQHVLDMSCEAQTVLSKLKLSNFIHVLDIDWYYNVIMCNKFTSLMKLFHLDLYEYGTPHRYMHTCLHLPQQHWNSPF